MDNPKETNSNFRNILIFSVSFQLQLGAYFTMAGIEKVFMQSAAEDDPSYGGDAFISLALVHIFYGICNFLAPSVLAASGLKTTLVISSLTQAMFNAGFLYPKTWVIYLAAIICGVGSAFLFVANGVYLTRCSTKKTISRNMGIYWAIQASGTVIGNLFVFWRLQGVVHLDSQMRFWIALILTSAHVLGSLTLCLVGRPTQSCATGTVKPKETNPGLVATLKKSLSLLSDKQMLLLIPTCFYAGYEQAMFQGIYTTTVGFTQRFGADGKKYVGLAGIIMGLGIVAGGLVFGIVGTRIFKSTCRWVGVLVAGLCHFVTIGLIYANFSNSATSGPTNEESLLINPPSVAVAMICAFLIGTGEGCLLPQIGAAIGVIWPEDPSGGHAIFRFFHGAGVGAAFVISTLTGLYNFLMIFAAFTIIGLSTFCVNEFIIKKSYENMDSKLYETRIEDGISISSNGSTK